jgi:hypothetical protein
MAPSHSRALQAHSTTAVEGVGCPLTAKTIARATGGPSYGRDGDRVVAEYSARHLSAGLHLLGKSLDLEAPGPGTYEVRHEVFADALREPERGSLSVEVLPVEEAGPPIRTLSELTGDDEDECD